jgi:hypothetical protein
LYKSKTSIKSTSNKYQGMIFRLRISQKQQSE